MTDIATALEQASQEADERMQSGHLPASASPFRDRLYYDGTLEVYGPAAGHRRRALSIAARGLARVAMGHGPIAIAQALGLAPLYGQLGLVINGWRVRVRENEIYLDGRSDP